MGANNSPREIDISPYIECKETVVSAYFWFVTLFISPYLRFSETAVSPYYLMGTGM